MFNRSLTKITAFLIGGLCLIPSANALPRRRHAGGHHHRYVSPSSFEECRQKWYGYKSEPKWKLDPHYRERIKLARSSLYPGKVNIIVNLHTLDRKDQDALVKDAFKLHYNRELLPAGTDLARIIFVVGLEGASARIAVNERIRKENKRIKKENRQARKENKHVRKIKKFKVVMPLRSGPSPTISVELPAVNSPSKE